MSTRLQESLRDLDWIVDLARKLGPELSELEDLGFGPLSKRDARERSHPNTKDPVGETITDERNRRIREAVSSAHHRIASCLDDLKGARSDLSRALRGGDPSRTTDRHVKHPYHEAGPETEVQRVDPVEQRRREGLCVTCGQQVAVFTGEDDEKRCKTCHAYKKRTGRERPDSLIRSA